MQAESFTGDVPHQEPSPVAVGRPLPSRLPRSSPIASKRSRADDRPTQSRLPENVAHARSPRQRRTHRRPPEAAALSTSLCSGGETRGNPLGIVVSRNSGSAQRRHAGCTDDVNPPTTRRRTPHIARRERRSSSAMRRAQWAATRASSHAARNAHAKSSAVRAGSARQQRAGGRQRRRQGESHGRPPQRDAEHERGGHAASGDSSGAATARPTRHSMAAPTVTRTMPAT